MLRWCATHWRPASIFLRLCSRNDFASPFCARLATPPPQPLYSFHAFFHSFYSIVFQHCYRHLLLHLTIVCFYAGNFYRCCLMYFFFFFFLNFFHLDWFGLSIFNFLYFSLGIPFCIPATLFGWPVLCRISGKNIRLSL